MESIFIQLLKSLMALAAGGGIGIGFGLIQHAAALRHERRQAAGAMKTGWALMPGSMRRIAGLLIALALVQVVCPILFVDGTQWWVSGGVVAGYGAILFRELRRRQASPLT